MADKITQTDRNAFLKDYPEVAPAVENAEKKAENAARAAAETVQHEYTQVTAVFTSPHEDVSEVHAERFIELIDDVRQIEDNVATAAKNARNELIDKFIRAKRAADAAAAPQDDADTGGDESIVTGG